VPLPPQNYKRCGDPFINYLSLNPVHDATGRLTHYVGVQASGRWLGWGGVVGAEAEADALHGRAGRPWATPWKLTYHGCL
jgi:hypothetical protein